MAVGASTPLQPARSARAPGGSARLQLRVLEGDRGRGKGLSSPCPSLPACWQGLPRVCCRCWGRCCPLGVSPGAGVTVPRREHLSCFLPSPLLIGMVSPRAMLTPRSSAWGGDGDMEPHKCLELCCMSALSPASWGAGWVPAARDPKWG